MLSEIGYNQSTNSMDSGAPWERLRLYCNGDIAASFYGIHGYSAPKERLISGLQLGINPVPVIYMSPSPHHDAYV